LSPLYPAEIRHCLIRSEWACGAFVANIRDGNPDQVRYT
jgi:hypothetical protein